MKYFNIIIINRSGDNVVSIVLAGETQNRGFAKWQVQENSLLSTALRLYLKSKLSLVQ